ncbi:DsbA family protein [Rhodospirillum rubrum]|uniref:DSBA oxidoreductase n=1 Tax=Rhodospirillum rubrum (strain ATCC 11170 / ATH 1.1.1 / DSM 467 / LMG 4362 / NCIMB 8255 / S1) TaxID=269796 RepID=Q2RRL7_RHORT|nr:DsbA family protein [Rhodospirillum rubrum]ABC23228.1 DSBA oxidoreductase [Rhodospirillum rubrum ATCC 11170]AEO48959.1 DSBA oxidoreductase [Rhodospirillum rubrum F11]MBK5954862.1 disulfide bond formation protein DsbA [Rhodospirillum rubrum]QXG79204.1 DsbA family protein [Rhodospirillum rubrum]HAP99861.1 DsbA family protein [Rhodospirillum rubrum]
MTFALRPLRALRPLLLAATLIGGALAPALAAEDSLSPAQQAAVRALIRDTLVSDPEILREAVQALQAKDEAEASAQQARAIKDLGPLLHSPEGLPALGNPKGDVTVIEFSDYNCGYCKRVFPVLWDEVEADGQIKLYVMEYPILGAESVMAARAALAAIGQDKYAEFHKALMAHKGKFTEEAIAGIARAQGLDAAKLKTAMAGKEVDAALARSFQIGQALGISGTPAFIVADRLVPGALDPATLKALVKEARSGK